jgi:NDP-sugar pyrophosphorylase family protein
LEEGVLSGVDSFAASKGISRSQAVEEALKEHFKGGLSCVILAGGPPQKLWVREAKCFRPLVEVRRKKLVEHAILKSVSAGFSKVIVVGSSEVNSAIYRTVGDGSAYSSAIKFVDEAEHLGTGHSLLLAKPFLSNPFLFIPCDHYFEFDLGNLSKFHDPKKFVCTLAVHSGGEFEWTRSSLVLMEGNEITDYWEHPHGVRTRLTSTMTGISELSIFEHLKPSKGDEEICSLQESVFPSLAKQGLLGGFVVGGVFLNVHSLQDAKVLK